MNRDNTLRMMIPARLDEYLRLWHRAKIDSENLGYNGRSAGLKGGGFGASVEDLEAAADAYAVGVLHTVWWEEVRPDSRIAIEVAMDWLGPIEFRMRRTVEMALGDGVEVLIKGLRREGVSV